MELKAFILDRFGTQKNAARAMRIPESYLSMVIKGKRKANFKLMNRLQEKGFDITYFDRFIDINRDFPINDATDLQFILSEYKRLINSKELQIRSLENLLTRANSNILELREQNRELKKRVDFYIIESNKIHKLVNSQ